MSLGFVLVLATLAGRLVAEDYDGEPSYVMRDDLRLLGGRPENLTFLVLVKVMRRCVCSGAIITPQWVVTAAHCVEGAPPISVMLRAGYIEPNASTDRQYWEQQRGLSSLVVFPSDKRLLFDMALLRTQWAFRTSSRVTPLTVCRNWGFPHRGELCLAAGWQVRSTRAGATHYLPRYLLVHVLKYDHCQDYYGVRFHRTMVCAKAEEGKSLCAPDGGGPLVCGGLLTGIAKALVDPEPQRELLLRGRQQMGEVACGGNRTFMAYTAVGKYRRWMNSHVVGMSQDWLARATPAWPPPPLLLLLLLVNTVRLTC